MRYSVSVCVVGGGLGGLTLAAALARRGVGCTVLERDTSREARTQGGSLDLHVETGQRALDLAGLTSELGALLRPGSEEHRILDPAGTVLVHDRGSGLRPEVDREALRTLLLDALPEGAVRWASHVTDPEALLDEHDLVVGADGASSMVRPLLTDVVPHDTGAGYREHWFDAVDHPDLAALVGSGSLWSIGSEVVLSAQRGGDGRIRAGLTARDDLADPLAGFAPHLARLMDAGAPGTPAPPVVRRIRALPTDLTWEPRDDVTLLGDAAHLMPPVGEGANQAMLDGAELALALTAPEHDDLPSALRAYEAAMWARVHPVAEMSERMERMLLAPDGLATMVRFFGGVSADSGS